MLPTTGLICHVTAVVDAPFNKAEKPSEDPAEITTLDGRTERVGGGGGGGVVVDVDELETGPFSVTTAEMGSAKPLIRSVSVTCVCTGIEAGAVYRNALGDALKMVPTLGLAVSEKSRDGRVPLTRIGATDADSPALRVVRSIAKRTTACAFTVVCPTVKTVRQPRINDNDRQYRTGAGESKNIC
jgi:hypothetical protein